MWITNKIRKLHDATLRSELSRPQRQFKGLLFTAGLLGALFGWQAEEAVGKCLLLSSGLALGLAAEKFAQSQIKRVTNSKNKCDQS